MSKKAEQNTFLKKNYAFLGNDLIGKLFGKNT